MNTCVSVHVYLNRFALLSALLPAALSAGCGSQPTVVRKVHGVGVELRLLNAPERDGVALLGITAPQAIVFGATLLVDDKVALELAELPSHLRLPLTGLAVGEHRLELHVLTHVGIVRNAIRLLIAPASSPSGHEA